MIKLLLLSALVGLSNAGVSCNSDGTCPFWCISCGCCAGTCYFGADLSGCTSFQCQGCQAAAKAGIAAGSAAACDAAASSACMVAGGLDPIADAVCPAIVTPLCLELFKDGTDQIDAFGACKAVGFCDDSDSPIDGLTVHEFGEPEPEEDGRDEMIVMQTEQCGERFNTLTSWTGKADVFGDVWDPRECADLCDWTVSDQGESCIAWTFFVDGHCEIKYDMGEVTPVFYVADTNSTSGIICENCGTRFNTYTTWTGKADVVGDVWDPRDCADLCETTVSDEGESCITWTFFVDGHCEIKYDMGEEAPGFIKVHNNSTSGIVCAQPENCGKRSNAVTTWTGKADVVYPVEDPFECMKRCYGTVSDYGEQCIAWTFFVDHHCELKFDMGGVPPQFIEDHNNSTSGIFCELIEERSFENEDSELGLELVFRPINETDDVVKLSIRGGFDSYETCTAFSEGEAPRGVWQDEYMVGLGCNEVGTVGVGGSFVSNGNASIALRCKGDGTDTMIQSFYTESSVCSGQPDEIVEVANGNCTTMRDDTEFTRWTGFDCATGQKVVSRGQGSGMLNGIEIPDGGVLMVPGGSVPMMVLRHKNETDELVEITISTGFESQESCTNFTEGQEISREPWTHDYTVALGCNQVGAVGNDGSFVPLGYSITLKCKGDGTDTMVQSFYHDGDCNGEAEEMMDVPNGKCVYSYFDNQVTSWSNFNCATGEEVEETALPTAAPTTVDQLRPHCENLDQRFCRRFKACRWARQEDGSKACVAKATSEEECARFGIRRKSCIARGCVWNSKKLSERVWDGSLKRERTQCTAEPKGCHLVTSGKRCKKAGCDWNKRNQECRSSKYCSILTTGTVCVRNGCDWDQKMKECS